MLLYLTRTQESCAGISDPHRTVQWVWCLQMQTVEVLPEVKLASWSLETAQCSPAVMGTLDSGGHQTSLLGHNSLHPQYLTLNFTFLFSTRSWVPPHSLPLPSVMPWDSYDAAPPTSLTGPWICLCGALHASTMARATLHHSSAKTTSSFPLSCPLGCAGPKGGSLAAASSTHVPLPAKCCAHWHWPRASLGSPQPQGLLGCSSWPLGRPAALPPPQQLQEHGSCLTDHMLHRFCPTFSLWCYMVTTQERTGHGQEFVLDTDSPSVRGWEKKINF